MAASEPLKADGLVRYWPFGVAGFCGPLASVFVSRWMPFYWAVGACTFVGFSAAVWMFQRTPARRSVSAILVSGLAAGLVGGALAFLFPWG